jgi:hypothetical protein
MRLSLISRDKKAAGSSYTNTSLTLCSASRARPAISQDGHALSIFEHKVMKLREEKKRIDILSDGV